MANAGCINAIGFDGTLIQTLQQLDSSNIGVGVQYVAPNPLDDKRLDYIKYTDKCGCIQCITNENEILIRATQGVLKNLTLTNDEDNEVVNVKRTEVFGSNWKKTVVRYKVGSYPTDITDGTLAVESLVKNQYEVSGFDVEGLEDGTTYYFSAFAVAQDDTIIVVQSGSITPSFASYRYILWNVDLLGSAEAGERIMQASEFEMLIGNTKFQRPTGTTASTNATSRGTGEDISKLIDGNTSTKFCCNRSSRTRPLRCKFDMKQNVNLKSITKRRRYNGNDTSSRSGRNPASGNIQVSKDGTTRKTISTYTASEGKSSTNFAIAYTGTINR